MSWLKFWKGRKKKLTNDELSDYLQKAKEAAQMPVTLEDKLRQEFDKDHSSELIPRIITTDYVADSQFKKPWLKNEVRDYLKTSKECRESDEVLCAAIWRSQINKMQGMNLYSFISLYEHKKVATAGSITRVRRLLQEQNPELRGSNWTKRHELEQTVREEARAAKWTEGMKSEEGA